jgi:uncharacterized membrane protein YhhN
LIPHCCYYDNTAMNMEVQIYFVILNSFLWVCTWSWIVVLYDRSIFNFCAISILFSITAYYLQFHQYYVRISFLHFLISLCYILSFWQLPF